MIFVKFMQFPFWGWPTNKLSYSHSLAFFLHMGNETGLEKDYNTVVKTLAIKELLLNFRLELKKLRYEFY